MEVKRISAEETHGLRSRVLRPGRPLAECFYSRDSEGVHFGVFAEAIAFAPPALLAVVTAHPDDNPLFSVAGQWRIRGMATEPAHQGRGAGALVLRHLLGWGRAQKLPLFWCNARVPAVAFYLKHGFTVVSETFELPHIGPHKVMKIDL